MGIGVGEGAQLIHNVLAFIVFVAVKSVSRSSANLLILHPIVFLLIPIFSINYSNFLSTVLHFPFIACRIQFQIKEI